MAGNSILRLAKNAVKRGSGLAPQRFLFTLRPTLLEGLHAFDDVVLLWQGGGSKLQYTLVMSIDKATGRVIFDKNCQLRQTTTVYKKADNTYEPKEYTFKLQSVKTVKQVDRTTTIGKCKVDFTDFCRLGTIGGEEEIHVAMTLPNGKNSVLRAFVGATFLKNVDPNEEQSEVSCMTSPTSMEDEVAAYSAEQDLSGFEERKLASPGPISPPEAKARRHKRNASATDVSLATISEGSTIAHAVRPDDDFSRTQSASFGASTSYDSPNGGRRATEPTKSGFGISLFGKKSTPSRAAPPPELTADQQARLRSQREKVDIQAEEDADVLRDKALRLLSQRDSVAAQVSELKQLLHSAQTDLKPGDRDITTELVHTKLALADAEYEKLQLKLALQVEANRTRVLSSKLTSLAVERDLFLARSSSFGSGRGARGARQ